MHHTDHHASVGTEADVIQNYKLAIWVVALLVIVVGSILFVRSLVNQTTQKELHTKQVKTTEVQAYRDTMQAQLSGYAVQDQARGAYRIPVEQAMELVIKEPKLIENPNLLTGGSSAPTPTSAPANAQPGTNQPGTNQPSGAPSAPTK